MSFVGCRRSERVLLSGRFRLALIGFLFSGCLYAVAAPHWQTGQGFRYARLDIPSGGGPGFERLDCSRLGVSFTNRISKSRSILNRNLLNGSGVAVGPGSGVLVGSGSPVTVIVTVAGWTDDHWKASSA